MTPPGKTTAESRVDRRTAIGGVRGFSIIEIVITMQIFTALVLIASPYVYKLMQVYAVRAAAREVYSDLQNARMGAVMEDHRYRLVLVSAQTYQLHDDVNNNGAIDAGESVITRNITGDAPGVSLSGTSSVTFLPDGTALAGATFSATKGTRVITVVVDNGGRMRVNYPTS